MIRIMRPGGRAMLQAWALEQEDNSRRKFHEQNVLVPWQLQQNLSLPSGGEGGGSQQKVTYQRFCHVYCQGELEGLASRVPGCRIIESGYDRSNWFLCFEKEELA
jgi:hypothetical protein